MSQLIPGGHVKRNQICPMCIAGTTGKVEQQYFSYRQNKLAGVMTPVVCEFCQGEGQITKTMISSLKRDGWCP